MDDVVFVVFLILIFAALFVYLIHLIAKEFMHIAELKGYHEEKYYYWTFLPGLFGLGIIGMLMVIALPPRDVGESQPPATADSLDDLPDL